MLYRTGVIAAAKSFGARYFANENPRERVVILKELAAAVCGLYQMQAPEVKLEATGGNGAHGRCNADGITLYGKTSMTTFLHELYHWMTFGRGICQDEALARQWSTTLFIRALPSKAGKNLIAFGNVMLPDRSSNSPQRRINRIIPVSATVATPVATE